MALTSGTRLGDYDILTPLGAGGMGEVYRARDIKLGRDVALKLLPATFTTDPDRVARFRREAQVLASLNHPRIGAIYGVDQANGAHFLVLELVDGESLDRRIARGPIPIDEALGIATQVAEALGAAHEKGIVHRDLKPANIALTADGNVKVLDFGLAKATEAGSGPAIDETRSPTITTPAMMTGVGVILGTAAYMSPEQARGRPADKRSDVWSFGCVLYEMVTGRRAFEGDDVAETLAAVLKAEPDARALPSSLSPAIRALVQGCLRKNRGERIGDISTALFLLTAPNTMGTGASIDRPVPRRLWKRALPIAAALVAGAAVAAAVLRTPMPTPSAGVTRFVITLPAEQLLNVRPRQALAISPDGTQLVYSANDRLFIRSMADLATKGLPGTEHSANPVFSPDSRSVVFWSDGFLKRIATSGGAAVTICQTRPAPSGIEWNDDGILFGQPGLGIMKVPASGGKPDVLIAVNLSEGLVHGPHLLPGGKAVLFTLSPRPADSWDQAQIVVHSLATGERTTIINGGSDARYIPTGHIAYAIGGTLYAVPFDLATLAVTGGAVPVIEGIRRVVAVYAGAADYAFSRSGSLVYLPGPASSVQQQDVMLFDRAGAAEGLMFPAGSYAFPRVSPDGKRIAFETSDGKESNIAIYELSGGSSIRRLTFGGNNRFPVWSADGRRVTFQSDRAGEAAVFWQPADGGIAERLTTPDPGTSHVPESWSPSGDVLLVGATRDAKSSLWTLSMRDRTVAPFGDVQSAMFPTDAMFSPDGRWVAYQTGEPGQGEGTTYVQPFPPTGAKYQIARGGRPLWSRDGTELFYVPAPGEFMAVTVKTQPTFAFSNPVAMPRGFRLADPANPRPYDMMADGRIVAVGTAGQTSIDATGPIQLHVTLNWFDDLKARMAAK